MIFCCPKDSQESCLAPQFRIIDSRSKTLLNISFIFLIHASSLFICESILFSRFWIIFTVIILNSLSLHIKKQRYYFANKVPSNQSYGFPVAMYGYESWTIKLSTKELMLLNWRRFLRVPWTARRSNQSILKEISPEYSLEGLMLKLKLQYFGHLMQRTKSLEKTLML